MYAYWKGVLIVCVTFMCTEYVLIQRVHKIETYKFLFMLRIYMYVVVNPGKFIVVVATFEYSILEIIFKYNLDFYFLLCLVFAWEAYTTYTWERCLNCCHFKSCTFTILVILYLTKT